MKLSKYNEAILTATSKGYKVIYGSVFYKENLVPLKLQKNSDGYEYFNIRHNAKSTKIYVHRLVAFQKFAKELFAPKIEVRHLDNNCSNNYESNIILGTHQENEMDKSKETRARVATTASHSYWKQTDKNNRIQK